MKPTPEQSRPVKNHRRTAVPPPIRKGLGVSVRLLLVVPLTACMLAAFLLCLPLSLIDLARRHS